MLAPNAMVELVQEFQHGGTRYRFVATREMGTPLPGPAHRAERRRLVGPLRPRELPGDPQGGGALALGAARRRSRRRPRPAARGRAVPTAPPAAPGRGLGDERGRRGGGAGRGAVRRDRHRRPALRRGPRPQRADFEAVFAQARRRAGGSSSRSTRCRTGPCSTASSTASGSPSARRARWRPRSWWRTSFRRRRPTDVPGNAGRAGARGRRPGRGAADARPRRRAARRPRPGAARALPAAPATPTWSGSPARPAPASPPSPTGSSRTTGAPGRTVGRRGGRSDEPVHAAAPSSATASACRTTRSTRASSSARIGDARQPGRALARHRRRGHGARRHGQGRGPRRDRRGGAGRDRGRRARPHGGGGGGARAWATTSRPSRRACWRSPTSSP